MKRILFIIALCTFAFAQVPDSVIVNKITELAKKYNENQEIIQKNVELNDLNIARQNYLVAQIEAYQALLKEEEIVEEKE